MTEAAFILRSFKTLGGKTNVSYEIHKPNGDIDSYSYVTEHPVSASLRDSLTSFEDYISDVFWLAGKNKVKCYGLKLSKYLEKTTVVLYGLMTTPSNRLTKIETEELPMVGELYKWTPELKSKVNHFNQTVYNLVFNAETSQTSLEFETDM